MSNQANANDEKEKGSAFQWWMVSNIAFGAGFSAFISLLIPPFVTDVTGNAADAGIVMAIISLAAVLGPVLGGFADKYRAHRLILSLGVLGMAVGFFMYSISADAKALYALDAIFLGVSVAAINAVGPVFIVGAGLSQALQAKRLTTFNLLAPVGQVIGGAIMAGAASAGMSFGNRFLIAAGFMLLTAVITWFSSAKPAKRIILPEDKPDEYHEGGKKSFGLKQMFISTFGLYLLILVLSSTGNNGINAQIANILPNVYGIDAATTSGLISLAGLLNILFFFVAGAWLGRSGAMPDFTTGNIMRLVGAIGLAVLGMVAKSPILLVAASMQIFYQANPFVRLTQPVLAMRFSTIPPGQATGWVIGAAALGSFFGSLIGGWLADTVGFNAINWMGAIAVGAAVLLIFFGLWPAERKKRAAERAAAESTA
jgi:predicted MFS family arabinose efflux permease